MIWTVSLEYRPSSTIKAVASTEAEAFTRANHINMIGKNILWCKSVRNTLNFFVINESFIFLSNLIFRRKHQLNKVWFMAQAHVVLGNKFCLIFFINFYFLLRKQREMILNDLSSAEVCFQLKNQKIRSPPLSAPFLRSKS